MSEFKNNEEEVYKVDFSQPAPEQKDEDVTTVDTTVEETVEEEKEVVAEEQIDLEDSIAEVEAEENVLEEVVEEATEEVVEDIPVVTEESFKNEELEGLAKFMEETGGSINDYVKLNQNIDEMDTETALREYYSKTKSHLDAEEISFLLEDEFSYDEDFDSENDIKRKKLAMKEKVADAKKYLSEQKDLYYNEVKQSAKLSSDQQEAVDFFNRYNTENEANKKTQEQMTNVFINKTNEVFTEDFKGFDFKVGDKTFRYNVKDADKVKENQSDISNFTKRFLDKSNNMSDAKGYHKSLFTANNPDAIANHFYEQGKADALKNSIAKSKNVDMTPRQGLGEIKVDGTKFKVLSGDSKVDFKVKLNRTKK